MSWKQEDKSVIKSTSPWLLDSEFCEFTSEDFNFIANLSHKRQIPKGSIIFSANDDISELYYINKGLARCFLLNSKGEEKLLPYNDRFLAIECFFHGYPIAYNAIAIEDTEVYVINREKAMDLLSRPSIARVLVKTLSMRCRILGWQINDLSFNSTISKVCRLICCHILNNQNNDFCKDGKRRVRLTHQELASMAAVHRITITNTITHLKKEGLIKVDEDGFFSIQDWEKIQELGFGEFI